MDPIEKAIRAAFEKGDARDRAFREKVYRQAFAALDRALQANPGLTVESAMNRRKQLQAKIAEIESEYIPVVAADPRVDVGGGPGIGRAASDPLSGSVELRMEPGAPAAAPEPVVDVTAPENQVDVARFDARAEYGPPGTASHDDAAVAPDPDLARARRRRRRPYALFFIAATLIAALGMGLWFAYETGLFLTPAERDTSVPNPPPTIGGEDFIPENEDPPVLSSQPDAGRDWIGIFKPDDATKVAAPTDASAQAMQDESGGFLRIRSGASGSAIVFDVGQGILEKIEGRKATFDIVARGGDNKATEMAIDCNFGELGDCGRKRYAVGFERADFLFEVMMPAAKPGAGGTIAVNSDFSGQGKQVDVYEIKVSVAP